ncbi:probable protein phosphatase 2C 25 [Olea europaea var. sylvestris]|uniref:probable protein phosphatase 2C 25 n=1 Tax=Olea europaea var. sylvestris TaxID=158386 RepID=UPI000C1CD319|nr:probable protein phosphatase 2C 25 [Olea europaea var. sylvestris]XP_022888066.1 probable protein phosphatase 2C 25 [Olea europaea var. sylvestris]
MFSWLGRTVSACLRPLGRYARMNKDDDDSLGGEDDALLWCKDLEKHSHGEFSFAVVQANKFLEDQSQVETGHHATFVGVYDGHGGPEASRFIVDHLFQNLIMLLYAKEILRCCCCSCLVAWYVLAHSIIIIIIL